MAMIPDDEIRKAEDRKFLGLGWKERVGAIPASLRNACPCSGCVFLKHKGSKELRHWVLIRSGEPFDIKWVQEALPQYRGALIEAICLRVAGAKP